MLKSPEEYFSEMEFSPLEAAPKALNPGERAFIHKYLGDDAFAQLQPVNPEAHFKPAPSAKKIFAEPKIEIVNKTIEVIPDKPAATPAKAAEKQTIEVAQAIQPVDVHLQYSVHNCCL